MILGSALTATVFATPFFTAPFFTGSLLASALIGALGTALGTMIAIRVGTRRKQSRRSLAFHIRMETEWKNARARMHLIVPIGSSHMTGTKYSIPPNERRNASTKPDFLRYIGG